MKYIFVSSGRSIVVFLNLWVCWLLQISAMIRFDSMKTYYLYATHNGHGECPNKYMAFIKSSYRFDWLIQPCAFELTTI